MAETEEISLEDRLVRLLLEFAYSRSNYEIRVRGSLRTGIDGAMDGYVTYPDLIQLLGSYGGGFGIGANYKHALDRLLSWGVLTDTSSMQPGVPHVLLNPQSIRLWNATGTLENCVRGTGYTYAKYSKATPALIVEKDDVEHIGTAAVIRFGTPKRNKYYLVTNRHVVDAAQGVKLKRVEFLENAILECPTKWNFCSTDDIAAVQIDEGASAEFFCLCHDAHLLDKVVTFGYPKIPFADRNYLAVHSGEINAVFGTTSKEEMFLISNQVAPGSSGGPVVDEKGFLAGLTAKAFQGKMEPDADFLISWNAAVTFKRIRAFLAGISGLEDWISGADEFLELRSDT